MSVSDIEFTRPEAARGNFKSQFRCYAKFVLFGTIVMRDCRIIARRDEDGAEHLMLIFPDKMVRTACPACDAHCTSNRDRYCPTCGVQLRETPGVPERAQVAHPVNATAREWIENAVFAAYVRYLEDPDAYRESVRRDRPEGLSSRVRQLLRSAA